jgi:hypothetical protein
LPEAWHTTNKFQAKINDDCSLRGTEPFHVIHMGPISDVVVSNMLLVANLCKADPIYGLHVTRMLDLVGWWSVEDERREAVGFLVGWAAALTFDLVLRAGGMFGRNTWG